MMMEMQDKDLGLRAFVIFWNNKFPFDFYMRSLSSVKFNSKKHRKMNLVDSLISMEEEIIMTGLKRESEEGARRQVRYRKSGLWLEQERGESLKVTDEDFDNFDFTKI